MYVGSGKSIKPNRIFTFTAWEGIRSCVLGFVRLDDYLKSMAEW